MKMKSFAMLVMPGLLAASFACVAAPALSDDVSDNIQTVQNSGSNASMGSGNGMSQESPNSDNSGSGNTMDQGAPDTATGDDDY